MSRKARNTALRRRLEEAPSRRVAIYLRRSTDEDNQPYSLEAQETRLRAFVASQPGDWQIVKIYSDDASGATTDREDLQKMLRAARVGMFDTLLVYRVDRFSRRLRDLVALLDDLEDAEVVFRSATEPFDTSTPVGRMLVQMLGVFAEFEREVIIDRVIAGMERKAAKGLLTGGRVPFGYAKDAETDNYIIDQAQAVTVRLIFDLYTKDRLGTRAIANVLNDRGLRTRAGTLWSQRSVEYVITNRQYLGEKSFRGIRVIDAHEAIIKRRQFNDAQRILAQRSERIGQRAANASDYTLTGKISCPSCGRKYIGTPAHGRTRRYRYYTCWSRNRYGTKAGCRIHRFNADEIEQAMERALIDFFTNAHEVIDDAIRAFIADHAAAAGNHRDELATIKQQTKETANALDRYLTAFEKGTLDDEDPDIQARLTKLKARSKQLRDRRAEIEFDLDEPLRAPTRAELNVIRDHIAETVREGNAKAKKALFEALIENITVTSASTIVPNFRIPLGATDGMATEAPSRDQQDADSAVRALPRLVGSAGLEPALKRT
ncbi:recombinase family protein [Asanoa hainanensis]|uniref:recombinase family protein n=1 Tax=Asanoa hainanensis TaxID=560556 RepID=UPI003CCC2BDA